MNILGQDITKPTSGRNQPGYIKTARQKSDTTRPVLLLFFYLLLCRLLFWSGNEATLTPELALTIFGRPTSTRSTHLIQNTTWPTIVVGLVLRPQWWKEPMKSSNCWSYRSSKSQCKIMNCSVKKFNNSTLSSTIEITSTISVNS